MVFRNIAYYRYRNGARLRDLGHELVPALADIASTQQCVIVYIFYLLLVGTLGGFFVPPREGYAPTRHPAFGK
eukprot:gene4115-14350_t